MAYTGSWTGQSPAFKAKVALAALKGDKTISELGQQFELYPNQIVLWKSKLKDQPAEVFGSSDDERHSSREEIKRMQAKIGSWPWRTIFYRVRYTVRARRAQANDQEVPQTSYHPAMQVAWSQPLKCVLPSGCSVTR